MAADPPEQKTTDLATADPAGQVFLWLIEGQRTEDIVRFMRESFPSCDPDQLLAAATARFEIVADADTKVIKGWCFEAFRELYRRMVDVGDYKGAITVIKELRKECS